MEIIIIDENYEHSIMLDPTYINKTLYDIFVKEMKFNKVSNLRHANGNKLQWKTPIKNIMKDNKVVLYVHH